MEITSPALFSIGYGSQNEAMLLGGARKSLLRYNDAHLARACNKLRWLPGMRAARFVILGLKAICEKLMRRTYQRLFLMAGPEKAGIGSPIRSLTTPRLQ